MIHCGFTQAGLFLGVMVLVLSAGSAGAEELKVGVLAFRGPDWTKKRWGPTADYLTDGVGDYSFNIVPLDLDQIDDAVADERVDFVLTNPGNYVDLEARYGISRIATLRNLGDGRPVTVFGAVVFTRADRSDINHLKELKGKTFMAVSPDAFGGFQMAWMELKDIGIDPFRDFGALRFAGFPQDDIVYAVRDGRVDAGTVRTDILERMAKEGKTNLSAFKVLNRRSTPDFPLLHSTRLYPEWPFSKLKHTPHDLAQQVAIALLTLPSDSPVVRSGTYAGWTIPLDYGSVHSVFQSLQIGPYEELGRITLSGVVRQYWHWFVVFALALLLMFGLSAYVMRTRAQERLRRRQDELAHVSRLATMGEMASGLAHELNQPLTAIVNYSRGCMRRLAAGRESPDSLAGAMEEIVNEAERAAEVMRRIREFVRKGELQLLPMSVNEAVRNVARMIESETKRRGVEMRLLLGEALPPVLADMIQIEQVVLNLVRNALDAMDNANSRPKLLRVETSRTPNRGAEVSVRDTGPGLSPDQRDDVFNPFFTTKHDGMGMGLSISRSIVEAHGGRLIAENIAGGGACFRFGLPAADGYERGAH